MSDRRVFRVRRVTWSGLLRSDADRVVVLMSDVPDPFPSRVWLGFAPHFGQVEDLSATPEEVDRWQEAAVVYMDAVGAAVDDLRRVQQQWWRPLTRLPVVGSRVSSKVEQAEEHYRQCVQQATEIYQPALREVEQRLAELETQRREQARQQWERQQAVQRAAEARFEAELEAWQSGPEERSAEVQRNVQARDEAVTVIVTAIEHAAATLEAAGRPGIGVISGSVGYIPSVSGLGGEVSLAGFAGGHSHVDSTDTGLPLPSPDRLVLRRVRGKTLSSRGRSCGRHLSHVRGRAGPPRLPDRQEASTRLDRLHLAPVEMGAGQPHQIR